LASDERERLWRRWQGWMAAAQDGDAGCYRELLEELLPYLRGIVGRRLGGSDAREDVVQNVLLSLHRARHTYRPERPLGPWLHAIARNAVTDHLRARGRHAPFEISLDQDGVPEPSAEPAPTVFDTALPPELAGALEALPPGQRQAVELLHVEGLSVADAASRVGISQSALKVRAHRGYRALRARLEEGG